ncbi:MAG: esterase-like activity of phytase family protein [Erythrobacter sp.]
MALPKRLIGALALAALLAPGTWLRTSQSDEGPVRMRIEQIAVPLMRPVPGWKLAGIWHYSSPHPQFGGYSALLALDDGSLRAFSDRGYRFTFSAPGEGPTSFRIERQFPARAMHNLFWDIEAATRDRASGTYWIANEQTHAIHRFTAAHEHDGTRDLTGEVDWPDNAGIEAMVRLDDGRFIILPEYSQQGLIFAGDPLESGAPQSFTITLPEKDYAITGAKQLPDGRLLVLMRRVISPLRHGWPPFSSLLAVGDLPAAGGEFAPLISLRLNALVPRENYEGLAIRRREDGRVDVWVIADDNVSLFQRTLLLRLIHTP